MALGDDQLKNVSAIQDAVSSANEALKAANREAKNIDSAFGRVVGQFANINKSAEKFVDTILLASDSRALRLYIKEVSPDVNLSTTVDVNGRKEVVDIPINLNFFWPDI